MVFGVWAWCLVYEQWKHIISWGRGSQLVCVWYKGKKVEVGSHWFVIDLLSPVLLCSSGLILYSKWIKKLFFVEQWLLLRVCNFASPIRVHSNWWRFCYEMIAPQGWRVCNFASHFSLAISAYSDDCHYQNQSLHPWIQPAGGAGSLGIKGRPKSRPFGMCSFCRTRRIYNRVLSGLRLWT